MNMILAEYPESIRVLFLFFSWKILHRMNTVQVRLYNTVYTPFQNENIREASTNLNY